MGDLVSSPFSMSFSTASEAATQAPVIDAVRVPPSAWSTSQSMHSVRGPSRSRSTTARSERPMSRWISTLRPSSLPLALSRCFPLERGIGEHRVLRGEPAAGHLLEFHPVRHALLDHRAANDARVARRHQHGAGGVRSDIRSEGKRAELVALATVVARHAAQVGKWSAEWSGLRGVEN